MHYRQCKAYFHVSDQSLIKKWLHGGHSGKNDNGQWLLIVCRSHRGMEYLIIILRAWRLASEWNTFLCKLPALIHQGIRVFVRASISCFRIASSWASFLFFSEKPDMTTEKWSVISRRKKNASKKRNDGG